MQYPKLLTANANRTKQIKLKILPNYYITKLSHVSYKVTLCHDVHMLNCSPAFVLIGTFQPKLNIVVFRGTEVLK